MAGKSRGRIDVTVEEMKKKKSELGLSYEQISSLSGVPIGTVQKVLSGITRHPRYATLKALSRAFPAADPEGQREFGEQKSQNTFAGMVRETGDLFGISGTSALKRKDNITNDDIDRAKYPRQGEYTLDDYLALPDDQRVEMIDGVFYDMGAPLNTHQIISHLLGHYFESFIDENGGPCQVFEAPTDVQLDRDDRTIVEPDILIVCDPEKVHLERVYGAPDLVIEILSKSTRRKDQTLKMWKYSNAGVREYWIVDPKKLTVAVYDFAHGYEMTCYTIHDTVPVGIYDGACKIDFEKIWKRIERFYPEGIRHE